MIKALSGNPTSGKLYYGQFLIGSLTFKKQKENITISFMITHPLGMIVTEMPVPNLLGLTLRRNEL
jgi:hypothetical protein